MRLLHFAFCILYFAFASTAIAAPLPHGVKEHFDPAAGKTIVRTIADGEECNPATWENGRVPQPGDYAIIAHRVNVMPTCHLDCHAVAIRGGGRLMSAGPISVHTLVVYPDGAWEHTAGAITIKPGPFLDGDTWSRGLLCFGMTAIKGQPKDPYVRAVLEPKRGNSSVILDRTPAWSAGDQVVIPDTRHLGGVHKLPWQVERRSIVSIDGPLVRLDRPLTFDHPGARNRDGQLERLPHIINLTRSIRIASADPAQPGHVALFGEAAIEWVEVYNMGRTTIAADSVKGRYALHWHHAMGPPRCVGCAVWNDPSASSGQVDKLWGIVIHGSNYGLIEKNVVYAYGGAGIVTEIGSPMVAGGPRTCETGNVFRENLTCLSLAPGGNTAKLKRLGTDGAGYWHKGQPNTWIDNYAYDTDSSGFLTMGDDGQSFVSVDGIMARSDTIQMIENRGFESWTCGDAWELWETGQATGPANTMTDSVAIHCPIGINPYYEGHALTVDGFTAYGGPGADPRSTAIVYGGADLPELLVRRSVIHGYPIACYWRARGQATTGRIFVGDWHATRLGVLVESWQQEPAGGVQNAIFDGLSIAAPMQFATGKLQLNNDFLKGLKVTVRNTSFAGGPPANFRFFMSQQSPDFVIPAGDRIPPELVGLTNAAAFEKFGKCINGEIVPVGAVKNPPGIIGYVRVREIRQVY